MTTLIGRLSGSYSNTVLGATTTSGQWTILNYLGTPYCQYILEEIDTSGLIIQEQTFFPVSAMIQGNQAILATNYIVGDATTDTVVVSTTPLTDADIRQATVGYMPGMDWGLDWSPLPSETKGQDLNNIIFGQHRTWTYNTTTDPYQTLVSQDNFGTNTGIASSRIYVYRITNLPYEDGKALLLYPIAIVLNGAIGEEEDLDRLMRMKRNTRLNA